MAKMNGRENYDNWSSSRLFNPSWSTRTNCAMELEHVVACLLRKHWHDFLKGGDNGEDGGDGGNGLVTERAVVSNNDGAIKSKDC